MLAASTAASKPSPGARAVLLLCGMAGGLAAFFALAGRLEAFWRLSRIPKAVLLVGGGALLGLLVALGLRAAWNLLSSGRARLPRLLWLAAALALGLMLRLALPGPSVPLLHVLEIETLPGEAGPDEAVTLVELRGADGSIIPFFNLQAQGWERVPQGLSARGPARLRYTFYGPPSGQVEALFVDGPEAGRVRLRLNGQETPVDLHADALGQRRESLPFQMRSRWQDLLALADWAALGFVLPLGLFLAPFALRASWVGARGLSGLRLPAPDPAYAFVFAWLLLALAPVLGVPLIGPPPADSRGDAHGLEETFFGRQKVLDLYAYLRFNVLRDRVFDQVLVGKDGWLVLANPASMDDYQNAVPFTEEELFHIQQRVDGLTGYFAERGITFLVLTLPNKNTVYPEMVPAAVPVIGQTSRLDQLLAYQAERGRAQILDVRPAMRRARQQHTLFYRTDTHWNDYGAYVAYAEVMAALQAEHPELQAHPLEAYQEAEGEWMLGDLGANWLPGSPPERFFTLEPRFPRDIRRYELLDERHLYSYRDNPSLPPEAPTAVVYHDSFMHRLAPFLTDHFRRSLFIWDPVMKLSVVESEQPDIVIYETTERSLESLLELPLVSPDSP